ncbi:Maf family protein [Rhodophyticola porphyridii]|uniref:Nucleoside triphosphate pyrophosphatase n=1 Tax=Rhodophyticola porphyridii TaxID=1852017 RepID=A0A3L9Y6U8_9RHOB|nr:Maf family nucleotide pyrophosphatase [Rhodophyticola porphyridii]RMA42807.1 septum formation protein Maf [Rhodophyticola porphyridii]
MTELILASGSATRQSMLKQVGIPFTSVPPRIDEEAIRGALEHEGATPRDVADTLAEYKARRVSEKHPGTMVIGCDQVLDHKGRVLGKPETRDDARSQLKSLSGGQHRLLSAVVVYEDLKPVWRVVGQVSLSMRPLSDSYIEDYLDRNWPDIADSVGGYKLEQEGARLFLRIDGDYFTVLGLPLLDLCGYLVNRGIIEG